MGAFSLFAHTNTPRARTLTLSRFCQAPESLAALYQFVLKGRLDQATLDKAVWQDAFQTCCSVCRFSPSIPPLVPEYGGFQAVFDAFYQKVPLLLRFFLLLFPHDRAILTLTLACALHSTVRNAQSSSTPCGHTSRNR